MSSWAEVWSRSRKKNQRIKHRNRYNGLLCLNNTKGIPMKCECLGERIAGGWMVRWKTPAIQPAAIKRSNLCHSNRNIEFYYCNLCSLDLFPVQRQSSKTSVISRALFQSRRVVKSSICCNLHSTTHPHPPWPGNVPQLQRQRRITNFARSWVFKMPICWTFSNKMPKKKRKL